MKGGDGKWTACCPNHGDTRQSLSVGIGKDGKVLLHCHAGCALKDIVWSMGLQMNDLFVDKPPDRPRGKPSIVATYTYPSGAQKLRRADKSFLWRHPDGKGGWAWNRKDVPRELYIAGKLAGIIHVVEGEKDADNFHTQLGGCAVCGQDGAGPGKWRKEYTEQLRGRAVVILQDNDAVGRAYAQETAAALHGVAKSVRLIDLSRCWPEIPEHGDISDMIEAKGAAEAARLLMELERETPEWEPSEDGEQASAADAPKPKLVRACDIPYEPPRWTIAPYFQRGKGTLIQGDNGTGKTAFMCAIAAHVTTGNPLLDIPVSAPGDVVILSVEDDLPILRGRIEASGGDLTKCHFMTNAAGLRFTSPEIEEAIKEVGAKMIVFDPIQAFMGAKVDMFRANETRPELAKLFEVCERNDCSCAIISHMGKAGDKSPVNRALGSVDIPAAMRSVMELTVNPDNSDECVMVHVKCSNAPKGKSIAYTIGARGGVRWVGFSPMTVEDLTIVKRKEKNKPVIHYENEPLVQVFNQLITDHPGGGFWSYADFKSEGAQILGFPPFADLFELRQKLDNGLARELQQRDGLIVTHSAKGRSNVRGIRVEQYKQPDGYQTKIQEG